MKNLVQKNKPPIMYLLWLLILLTIPMLSVFGRSLQQWLLAQVGLKYVILFMSLSLFVFCLLAVFNLGKAKGRQKLLQLLWPTSLLVVILLTVQSVAEFSHVIIFGLFGFFSLRLFPVFIGIALCVLISGSDELLQYYLVDRVGDLQDVLLNLMSTVLGGWCAFLSRSGDLD